MDDGELFRGVFDEEVLHYELGLVACATVRGSQYLKFEIVCEPGRKAFIITGLDVFADWSENVLGFILRGSRNYSEKGKDYTIDYFFHFVLY